MRTIRGWAAGIAILLASLSATGASAKAITLDDVIRLNAAGVIDEIIMSEVIVTKSVFELSPEDIIRLSEVGISDDLIQFLIDTGRTEEGSTPAVDETPSTSYDDEVDEDDSTTYVGVSLNYGYGSYWYDPWWDPWYCSYSPFHFSFSWGWGYPGWSYAPYSWSSYYPYGSYCGYGPYYGYGWSGCSGYYNGYGGYPGATYGLSTTKWKTNGAGTNLNSTVAHKELSVRDHSPTLASLERVAGERKLSVRDYAKLDTKSLDERVRPVRNARPTKSVKAPRSADGPVKYAEVSPDRVREPASGSRPTKVVRPAPKSHVGGKAIESRSVESTGKGKVSKTGKSSSVRPRPSGSGKQPASRSAPAVRSAPAGKSSKSSPAVRSAPAGKSSHAVRSAPSRSAPTRSMGTRSAPSYRSAPMRSSGGYGGHSGGGKGRGR